jgi:hypothetical protein
MRVKKQLGKGKKEEGRKKPEAEKKPYKSPCKCPSLTTHLDPPPERIRKTKR